MQRSLPDDYSPQMTDTESKTIQGTWRNHVMQYKADHGVTLKAAMKQAGATYTKKPPPIKKEKGAHARNAWMDHIAAWRQTNPEWKKNHSYKEVLVICKGTYGKENQPPPPQDKVFSAA